MANQHETTVADMDDEALLSAAKSIGEPAAIRGAAERELTRRDPGKVGPLLARMVRDEAAPAESRASAATALGRHPSQEAEAALKAALATREPLVVRRTAEALGRIGGPEALKTLRQVAMPREPAAARALSFAKSFIAYRFGLNEELLSAPAPAPLRGEGAPLTVEAASEPLQAEVAKRLPGELPGLEARVERAVRVACERQEVVVLPTGAPAGLSRSSAVVAVVMKRAHSLDRFATHLYILSHPDSGDRIALFGVRPDGTMTHMGEAWPGDDGLTFKLEALATPYSDPMRIEGAVDARGTIRIVEARAATGPRSPLPAPRRSETPAIPHPVLGKAAPFQPRARGKVSG